jgi:hypothetical protein
MTVDPRIRGDDGLSAASVQCAAVAPSHAA